MKEQLDKIGKEIGYGRAIQLLGQLWDDMMQARYPDVGRQQESLFRREDIERIEAGLHVARKVVYVQKRGRKGQITSLVPFDFEIPNVAWTISDTPLYGRPAQPDQGSIQSGFVRFEYVGAVWRLVDLNGDIIAEGIGDAYESTRAVREA